ncbi:hydantoin utilization protein A [Bacillaceae bacterium]
MMELFTVFAVGFLLGLRHAFDPDHVVAVSTIASRTGNLVKAVSSGAFWGIGHTFTLFVIGMILIPMKWAIPKTLGLSMEMLVGLMLVVLGWTTIRAFRRKKVHMHVHEHDGETHIHFHSHEEHQGHHHSHLENAKTEKFKSKSFVVGVIHGLAGSGALVLLTMSTLDTWQAAALYILVFGLGTLLGMMMFALLLALPFVLLNKYSIGLERKLGIACGFLSVLYGLYFLYEIAFVEGLLR